MGEREDPERPLVVLSGDLGSRRDVIVEGRVEADAGLVVRRLTVGRSGLILGDVHGSTILVEGEVQGDLVGDERVVIRRSGTVRGNITAPTVDLEYGARLQGSVHTRRR